MNGFAFLGCCFITYSSSFIIPNELPSLLSIVYSNIPPVKIGVDSRFGYGFRLGPHADYQTLIEIGPQTNTNSISTNGTTSKRESVRNNRTYRFYYDSLKKNSEKAETEPKLQNQNKKFIKELAAKNVSEKQEIKKEKAKYPKPENLETFPTKFLLI